MSEAVLCLMFEGLITNELTGEEAACAVRFQVNIDTTVDMDVWGRALHTEHHFEPPGKSAGLHIIQARLFGSVPGGHRERLQEIINDPVNIDRTRRNSLNDRLARRTAEEVQSMAAD